MAICCHHLILWWCSMEEGNDNLLSLPSFYAREEKDNDNVSPFTFVVLLGKKR